MIWLLRLFGEYRELEDRAVKSRRANSRLSKENERLAGEVEALRDRVSAAEKRNEELTEKLMNAGDAVAMRVLGRRMFSKAPVEAPPQHQAPPVNISSGSRKIFGRDAVRKRTVDFFEKLAKETGVTPEAPKTN